MATVIPGTGYVNSFNAHVNPVGIGLFSGGLVALLFALGTTLFRLWSRKIKKQTLLWSDALILVALVRV